MQATKKRITFLVSSEKKQKQAERIWELSEKGLMTPRAVVEDAKKETSPLHGCFEWDDTVAAENYRVHQARILIRTFNVEIIPDDNINKPHEANAFYHVEIISEDGETASQGYVNYDRIASDNELKQQIIDKAKRELNLWRVRYSDLQKEFSEVFNAVDNLPLE